MSDDRRLRLLQATAVAANEATTVEEAMQAALDAVCAFCGWSAGHHFAPSQDGTELVPSSVWHLDDPSRFGGFRRITESLRFRLHQGLPGRVLASGRPAWIADVAADPDFHRKAAAVEAGITSAFAFPVLSGSEVVGILEFFSLVPAEPDPPLLEVMGQIGTQLGRVVERTRAAEALEESEERMRLVLETAGDAFVGMDADGIITDWNAAAEELFGWLRTEAMGRRLSETIIPVRYREMHEDGLPHYLATGEAAVFGQRLELHALHRRGHELPVELSVWPVRQAGTVRFHGFVHDISERRQAAAALREATARFQTAFDHAPIGMALVDLTGRILQANRAYSEMIGYSRDGLRALTVGQLTHPDDAEASTQLFRRALAGELTTYRVEKRYVHADGHPVWAVLSVSAVTSPTGELAYFIGQIEEITARKEAEAQLTRQALHDPLTDLPNRSLMLDRLHQAIIRAQRDPGTLTVMFVDLDDFKLVNDSLGHGAGDEVLSLVASRLLAAVRAEDTVCRLGGDEFVVICEGLDGEAEADVMAARVEAAVREPCVLGQHPVVVTASVGVVVSQSGGQTADELLRDADAAMYRAKGRGKARHEVFDEELRVRAGERLRLERDLCEALEAGRMNLLYQPIVELAGGAVVGAEAILRFDDPERGPLLADQLLDVAEDSGLIISLGTWVLEQACHQAAAWHRHGCGLPLTVNLGARQMARPHLAATVQAALDGAGLEPSSLCLDLPELALVQAAGSILKGVVAVRDIGVRLGINDWGSGDASITSLSRLPVDCIKIGRRLVAGLGSDSARTATVAALIGAGQAFSLTTIAKGVDGAEQQRLLRELGCTLGQGDHLAPPQAPDALLASLTAQRASPTGR